MKRVLTLGLIWLLALIAQPALAQVSDYRFDASGLGFSMVLDEAWMDAVGAGKLQFWPRLDADARKDGVRGYGLVYEIASLDDLEGETYPEVEAWLNEHCVLLGGVVAHEPDAPGLDALYPDFTRTTLGTAGATQHTMIRTAQAPGDGLARDVWAALGDEGRFKLFDPDGDYGMLGAFETMDLAGQPYSNEALYDAKLTVVNFWGTFCQPCIAEMPTMGKLAAEYEAKGVKFLGVVTDAYDADTVELAKRIIEQTGANYPHILPVVSGDVLSRIQYIPTTVYLDSAGNQVGGTDVGSMDEQGWIDAIESRLEMLE